MSNTFTARRICATVLVVGGVLGSVSVTASATDQRQHRPQSRVVIDDIDLNRNGRGGTVELENEGRRGESLRGWKICDDDRNCKRLSGYLRAHDDERFRVNFLNRHDRVFLINDHNRVVDIDRVSGRR